MIVLTPPAGYLAKAVRPSPGQLPLFAAGPFIGPRGGKWADPQHKIPWTEPTSAPARPHGQLPLFEPTSAPAQRQESSRYPGWTRLSDPKGSKTDAKWAHESGWVVSHCGHMTALYPFSAVHPDHPGTLIVSNSGHGFGTLEEAFEQIAALRAGTAKLDHGQGNNGAVRRIRLNGDEHWVPEEDRPRRKARPSNPPDGDTAEASLTAAVERDKAESTAGRHEYETWHRVGADAPLVPTSAAQEYGKERRRDIIEGRTPISMPDGTTVQLSDKAREYMTKYLRNGGKLTLYDDDPVKAELQGHGLIEPVTPGSPIQQPSERGVAYDAARSAALDATILGSGPRALYAASRERRDAKYHHDQATNKVERAAAAADLERIEERIADLEESLGVKAPSTASGVRRRLAIPADWQVLPDEKGLPRIVIPKGKSWRVERVVVAFRSDGPVGMPQASTYKSGPYGSIQQWHNLLKVSRSWPDVIKYLDEGGLKKALGPFVGPRGGLWADPQHTVHWSGPVDVKPHEALGMYPIKVNVADADEDHVRLSPADGGSGVTIPRESLRHFIDDLRGVVDVPAGHPHPAVAAVARGEGTLLGKGDDGLAFRVGDAVVKVSTTVPYQPFNSGHRTPVQAAAQLKGQVEVGNKLADAGVPVVRSEYIEHGDKAFQVKPYVEIPEKLTREQLDEAGAGLRKMHQLGYAMNDSIQVGILDGRAVFYDTGKAAPARAGSRDVENDLGRLSDLYRESGVKLPLPKLPIFAREITRVDDRAAHDIARGGPKISPELTAEAKVEVERRISERATELSKLSDQEFIDRLHHEGAPRTATESAARQRELERRGVPDVIRLTEKAARERIASHGRPLAPGAGELRDRVAFLRAAIEASSANDSRKRWALAELPDETIITSTTRTRDDFAEIGLLTQEAVEEALGHAIQTSTLKKGGVGPAQRQRAEHTFVGCVDIGGLRIHIENLAGDTRSGVEPDGTPWRSQMHHHYGEIEGTMGADGEPVDAYVGPNLDAKTAYVVHQNKPWTGRYDEDKVMLGFDSAAAAVDAYKAQYDGDGWYGGHTEVPVNRLLRWCGERSEKMTKAAGPFVGPRGGLWADPEHKVHWVADPNGRGARQADWVGKEPAAVRNARAKRITAALAGFKAAADRYKRTRDRRDYDAVFRAITEYGHAAALQPQGRDGLAEVAAAKLRSIGHRIPQPPRLEHRPESATQLSLFARKVMFDLRKSRLAQLSQRA